MNKFDNVFSIKRPIVCIQGLGFVGAAMAVAVSEASDENGEPYFNVIGVDLPNSRGNHAVQSLNLGIFPVDSNDEELRSATVRSKERGNLLAVTDAEAYSIADVIIVDVNLDLGPTGANGEPTVQFDNFNKAIDEIGSRMKPNCLVLVETTVPPGTCENIVYPRLKNCFRNRDLTEDSFYLAHSYERVMPGEEYLYSIINFWRVFAGINEESAIVCENFLKKIVNTAKYPMTRLKNTTSSETAKVLENSYRASNIAFIEEWGRFAEEVGVDLFSVIDAIRVRPTHNNIRQPGFGVGGYCLTKDPLFGRVAASQIFKKPYLDFPFSRMAVEVNKIMPTVSVKILEKIFNGDLVGKKILLLGVSYRPDVSDTRYSPSEIFVRSVQVKGVNVTFQDPMVKYWDEMKSEVLKELPEVSEYDALVFAVGHKEYLKINFSDWLKGKKLNIIDTNRVLADHQIKEIKELHCLVHSVGRGE